MELCKELVRLATYTLWPNSAKMSPLSLARSGFFYVGHEDEVECFQCKIRLKGWTEGHDLVTRHRQEAPHCPLLNENCKDDVSLDFCVSFSNNIKAESRTESDDAGIIINGAVSNSDETLSEVNLIYSQALSRAQRSGLFLNRNASTIDRIHPDFRVLRDEKKRLSTFYDWPSNGNANPVDLAREGFFYTGSADRVRCVHCGGCLKNWEPTDIPRTEHKKQFPNCPSFQVHNDYLTSESNSADRNDHSVVQQSLEVIPSHANGSNPILGSTIAERKVSEQHVSGDAPKFPEYFDYSVRVESFRQGIIAAGQSAEGLADAGWFYVGPNDKVRCFQCGGNLRDWEPDDDPWVEHNRWYKNCQYIRAHRPANRSWVPENSIPTMHTNVVGHGTEPREAEAQLDTPTVRTILSMGYSLDRVKAVIESRLSTTGDDFPNAESLLDALFQLEEAETTASTGAAALTCESVKSPVQLSFSVSSVPPPSSSSSSSSSSLASNDSRMSLKAETAVNSSIPEAIQTKTKAVRKKRNKKKKTSAEEPRDEEPGIVEKALLDEHRLEEIQDEDATSCLEEENRLMREQRTCKVCMDAEVNTVFLPCGHLVCCATCSPQLRNCPMCRTFIRGTVKTFLS